MKQNLRRAVNLTALVLAAGLLIGLFTGCPNGSGPNGSNESSQPTTVTITVEGDTNVTVNEPKTIEVAKGTKWSEVKLKVKVSYTPGYEAAGFKLDSESGIYLNYDYPFNGNKTVFAISKRQGSPDPEKVTITVKGDDNVIVNEPKIIAVTKSTRWKDIKANINVSYKAGYEAAGFKLDSESGTDLNDDSPFYNDKTVFAISQEKVEKVTITVKGDANVLDQPNSFKVTKGSKWSEVKAKVEEKVNYTNNYQAAGFKLDSESGVDLKTDDVFNEDKTVFVLSSASIFTTDGSGSITGYNSGITLPAKLVIPSKIGSEGITKIGDNVFSGCTTLKELELPDTLTEIGRSAFKDCPIETLVINCNITLSIIRLLHEESVINNLINLIIGEGIKEIGSHTSGGWTMHLFDQRNKLKKVKLPESLVVIGEEAFWHCGELIEINFPSNLERIKESAFSHCIKLAAVDLSSCKKLTHIELAAFSNCTSLLQVKLSESITSIDMAAFEKCENLINLDLSTSKLTQISSYCFQDCKRLSQVKFPENITVIRMDSFKKCESLTKLDLSSYTKLHTIEKGAFGGCTGLTEVNLPQSITGIGIVNGGYIDDGYGTFINCTGLTSIDLSGCTRLKYIDKGSFYGCKNAEIKLPDSTDLISEGEWTGGFIKEGAFGRKYDIDSLCKKVLIKSGNNYEKLKKRVIDSGYDENRIESY